MHSNRFVFWCTGCVALIMASSCSFGLDPVSSRESTIVSISLGGAVVAPSSSSNRAIVQGGGYLYIRTFGGPSGDSGPFYGPYEASSGSTFKTADIPAGLYSNMYIIYSARALNESDSIDLGTHYESFGTIMRYDDDVFTHFLENSDINFRLFTYFNGDVSASYTGKVTVRDKKINPIVATLVPVSNSVYTIFQLGSLVSQNPMARKFFHLTGVTVDGATTRISFNITFAPTTSPLTLERVILYTPEGKLIQSFESPGTVPYGSSVPFVTEAPYEEDYYLYLEYQSSAGVDISFSGSLIEG